MRSQLLYVGVTHHTAGLELRERLDPTCWRPGAFETLVDPRAREAVVLSTCGRVELYVITGGLDDDRAHWRPVLADLAGQARAACAAATQILQGRSAARHLLRVAAGLDSQIIGEDQIQGQVRRAFLEAQKERRCGPVLSALFRAGIHTGKRVRHETTLNRIPRSFAKQATDDLLRRAPSANQHNIVIVGSGVMAQEIADQLSSRCDTRLVVAGRDAHRAAVLAARIGAEQIELSLLNRAVRGADAVFACTSAPQYLITAAMLGRRAVPCYCYDLGMPRNIEPVAAQLPNVILADLDALAPRCGRQAGPAQAAGIVAEELQRFEAWWRNRLEREGRQRILRPAQFATVLRQMQPGGVPALPGGRA